MKKRVVSLVLATAFMCATALNTFAGTVVTVRDGKALNDGFTIRQVTKLNLKDLGRFLDEATENRDGSKGKGWGNDSSEKVRESAQLTKKIVNANRISATEWAIRLAFFDNSGKMVSNSATGDYYVSVPNTNFLANNGVTGLGAAGKTNFQYVWKDGAAQGVPYRSNDNAADDSVYFGPAWAFVGVFGDDSEHNIGGFALAERIKRWPAWDDLTYTGVTEGVVKKTIAGMYPNPSAENFFELHVNDINFN